MLNDHVTLLEMMASDFGTIFVIDGTLVDDTEIEKAFAAKRSE